MDGMPPYDAEFNAALSFCLSVRGWNALELCERTRLAPGRPRRVNPSSMSDWKLQRKHPSNPAVMAICQTLAVPRSYFFQLGEEIENMRHEQEVLARRRRILEEGDVEAILQAVDEMSSRGALAKLGEVEQLIRERRAQAESDSQQPANE